MCALGFPRLAFRRSASEPELPIPSHVAFIVNNYPPHVGGVERHVSSLAAHLVAEGHRVTVITLGGAPSDGVAEGIRVVRLKDWLRVGDVLSFPVPGATSRIVRLLRDQGVTAISTHTRFFPMTTVGLRVGRRSGIPVIHTEHGSGFVRGVNPLVGVASRIVDLTLGRSALRRARVVLAVSERVAAFVARLSGVQARVFYNAIDLEPWRAAVVAPQARLVFVGRLVPGKGWRELLETAALIRGRGGPRFDIAIYGDGPESGQLAQAVRDLDLEPITTIAGQVQSPELASGVAGAVLVNPTTLAEGFQTSMIEVIAAGGRVVTFDVAGAEVLARDGAPVRIVGTTPVELADAVSDELARPSAPYPPGRLDRWGWRERAVEYSRVVAEVAISPEARP